MTHTHALRLLGIDPGLQRTGWGLISIQGNTTRHLAHGIIQTKTKDPLAQRLAHIVASLRDIIDTHQPHEAAIEDIFMNNNAASTLKLGMARGIGLMVPASKGLPVFEYGANHVKKMIVGVGHADKSQVAMMVQRFLPTAGAVNKDAADALVVALCHCHSRLIHGQISSKPQALTQASKRQSSNQSSKSLMSQESFCT